MGDGRPRALTTLPELRLIRLPGEFGPVVRCFGELSADTVEALQKELLLLEPLGHPALTLNVSGCASLDTAGALAILRGIK